MAEVTPDLLFAKNLSKINKKYKIKSPPKESQKYIDVYELREIESGRELIGKFCNFSKLEEEFGNRTEFEYRKYMIEQELDLLKEIRHPNIEGVEEYEITKDCTAFMVKCQKTSLRQLVRKRDFHPFEEMDVQSVMRDCISALYALTLYNSNLSLDFNPDTIFNEVAELRSL